MFMSYLAQFFLFFTNIPFFAIFIPFGYFCLDKKIFTRGLFILFFTMILSQYLKSIWQIPLAPHLGEGWAYPSGHMQTAVAFYGWLAYEFRNRWVTLCVLGGLIGIGWALVYKGYHSVDDVLAGVLFGAATVGVYACLCRLVPLRFQSKMGLFLTLLSLALALLTPKITVAMWLALAGLGGLSVALYFDKRDSSDERKNK